ncbi:hypothetical protein T4B_13820 [Trichinella pseudospiralis]|uniref:Uncharacterized protein n=1 Tax=Trichinella pseudospiralis TaxID=6337 RepID=A0A0V1GAG8_TRIPS|nr:hypothetical protein T4B_13820 [Trichinella pseudospiralis]
MLCKVGTLPISIHWKVAEGCKADILLQLYVSFSKHK